jgi:hypothetical protein
VALLQPQPMKKVGGWVVGRGAVADASSAGPACTVWRYATAPQFLPSCSLSIAHPGLMARIWGAQEMRELIARCWSPNPEDRPPFSELVKELEGILAKLPRSTMVRQSTEGGCCAIS